MLSVPVEMPVPVGVGLGGDRPPLAYPELPVPGMYVRIHPCPASVPSIEPIIVVPTQIPRAPRAAIKELLESVPNKRTIDIHTRVLKRAPRRESGTRYRLF